MKDEKKEKKEKIKGLEHEIEEAELKSEAIVN